MPEKFYFLIKNVSSWQQLSSETVTLGGLFPFSAWIPPVPLEAFKVAPESDVAVQTMLMNSVQLINQCLYPK